MRILCRRPTVNTKLLAWEVLRDLMKHFDLLILREIPNSCAFRFLTVVICRRAMALRASRRLIPSCGV